MRTTLTLDDDVARALASLCERDGASFKEIVNATLRAGIVVMDGSRPLHTQPYRMSLVWAGEPIVSNIDDVWGVIDRLDGPESR